MTSIGEPAREVSVILETDVLVVGSGPGGLAAALAAARAGARTALIDRNGCFGGNITQVGVEGFAWYRHEETVDCEGIGIEFEERAKSMGAAMPEPQSSATPWMPRCSNGWPTSWSRRPGSAHAASSFRRAHRAERRDPRGHHREQGGTRGDSRQARGRCHGDADVAARAGAPTHKTPREQMMAASVMFSMTGVNKRRFIER